MSKHTRRTLFGLVTGFFAAPLVTRAARDRLAENGFLYRLSIPTATELPDPSKFTVISTYDGRANMTYNDVGSSKMRLVKVNGHIDSFIVLPKPHEDLI